MSCCDISNKSYLESCDVKVGKRVNSFYSIIGYYMRRIFLDAQSFLVSSALCPLLWVLVALFVAKVILTDSLKISLWERLILWCFLPKSLAGSVSVLGSGGSWQTNITATNLTTSFIPPFLIVNFPECICLSCITSKYICTN